MELKQDLTDQKPQTIYDFKSASEFLRWGFEKKRAKNPKFSMRAWAKKLGFKNNTPLSLMLIGRRPIPRKHTLVFAQELGLDGSQLVYFETLVELSHAKTYRESVHLLDRLYFLRPKPKLLETEIEPFEFYEDPLNGLISEMLGLADFTPDLKWIKSRIRFDVTTEQIERTVKRLFSCGFLDKDDTGQWRVRSPHVFHKPYLKHKAVQQFHRNIIALTSHIIFEGKHPVKDLTEERDIQSYALAIKKSSMPRARAIIWECVNKLINEVGADHGTAENVYQFNIQFVPFTIADNHEVLESPEKEAPPLATL